MSEKFKKALRIAVNVGCGFEGDAEDAAELLALITDLEARIAELEAESERFTVHGEIERQDAEERAHLEKLVSSLKARIAGLEEKQRWIPVSERLPEAKGNYMTVVVDGFDHSRSVDTLQYFGDGDWFTWSDWYVVTHWKEKTEPPEVTE